MDEYVVVEQIRQLKDIYTRILTDYLLDWARMRDLTEIRLTVYSGNDPAIRAYEKAGFNPYITEMRLNLDE